MNVSIGKDLEAFVQKKVAGGDYASASEVVREGLRLLKEKDLVLELRLQALRGEIEMGIAEANAGELEAGSQVIDELRAYIKNKTP